MTMITDAINRILELGRKEEYTDTYGREHLKIGSSLIPFEPSRPSAIKLHTLNGLLDLIKSEKLEDKCCIWINDPSEVSLVGFRDEKWQKRATFAQSNTFNFNFPLERFMDIETFIIKVQCEFKDSANKKTLIDHVSKVTGSEVLIAEDDGIAQVVTARSELSRKERVKLNPIIDLQPWRTFREVEQPQESFLLRMKKTTVNGEPTIAAALFSTDGNMWQHEAVENIYTYLQKLIPTNIPIIR